ncbi:unnamed protein product [Rhodiola kirilowii]
MANRLGYGAEEYEDERGESTSSELNDFQKLSDEFQAQVNKLAEALQSFIESSLPNRKSSTSF